MNSQLRTSGEAGDRRGVRVHSAAASASPRRGRPVGSRRSRVLEFTKARVELGLSLRQLAAELAKKGQGCTREAVGSYERGVCLPTTDRLAAIAEILGVSEDACERMFYGGRHA